MRFILILLLLIPVVSKAQDISIKKIDINWLGEFPPTDGFPTGDKFTLIQHCNPSFQDTVRNGVLKFDNHSLNKKDPFPVTCIIQIENSVLVFSYYSSKSKYLSNVISFYKLENATWIPTDKKHLIYQEIIEKVDGIKVLRTFRKSKKEIEIIETKIF